MQPVFLSFILFLFESSISFFSFSSYFVVLLPIFNTFLLPIFHKGHISLQFVQRNFSEFVFNVFLFLFVSVLVFFDDFVLFFLEIREREQMRIQIDFFLPFIQLLNPLVEEGFFHFVVLVFRRHNFFQWSYCIVFASF